MIVLMTPMAHKTFSKEQFKFHLYKCKVSISSNLREDVNLDSISNLKVALMIAKSSFPSLETNLLFLRKGTIELGGLDRLFYSFSYFLTKR